MLLLDVMPFEELLIGLDMLLLIGGDAVVDAACGVVCANAAVPKDATTRDASATAIRVFMMRLLVWIELAFHGCAIARWLH
ncbi:MAG TPA: hypothetical protein VHA71_09380 [Rhodanobacteraceae bacterium]|jgi:hypothetical protein|nr:hypothetical protein [Rhodanobacteraceae bacterium]